MKAQPKPPDVRLNEDMITIKEVAQKCGLSERGIRNLIAKKEIPFRKLGAGKKPPVRFYPSEIDAWINQNGVVLELNGEAA